MSSSSESSCAPPRHLLNNLSAEELSSELPSSEEKFNNCILKSGQNNSIKRRHISSSEDYSSSDYSPPLPRRRKVTKHSNGGPSNAKQAEPITVQNCRHCCSICDEEYNRTMRCPLCLPCGHTFCSVCLRAVENSGSRLCPMCRGDFGVDLVARLKPCFQLIPGNELLAQIKWPVNYVPKTQNLDEGTIWNVKCLNQLQEVEHALNSSSVRPKEVAISVNGDTEVPLPQMTLFLDLLRRTRCSVSISLLDYFLDRPSKMQLERDEQLLKGLLKGRCRVVEYRGYMSRNILKHLETLESLKTLGFGLIDANDVRATISAMDKEFMDDVTTMHVYVSKDLDLKNFVKKICVPPNMLCVAHFHDVDDDDVKVIPRILDALFTTDSSLELQLHRVIFSLRGADALLGVMRDVGLKRAVVESLCLKPEEKITMDSSCKKFNCKMIWT